MSTALPRHIYHAILRVLRPAEAAVRRLIIIAARDIILKPRPPRPAPVGLAPNPNGAPRTPAFQLIEPLKTFAPFVDNSDFEHIWTDEENDDFEAGIPPEIALPRISVPGLFDPVFIPPAPAPSKFDLINAAHIARRLMALSTALKSLPNQARRLARWQAKRDQKIRDVALKAKAKLHRLSPTRPGRPACPSNQATKSTQSCANATAW